MVKSANFTVGDGDHFGGYFVTTTTAATIVATLPVAGSTNKGRVVPFVKSDATTGIVQIAVDGGGHLNGLWDALYLIKQGDSQTVVSDGTLWSAMGSCIQPVSGEPSLGTPHQHPRNATNRVITNALAVATGWSAAQTVADAPTGATRVYAFVETSITNAAAGYTALKQAFSDNNAYTPTILTSEPKQTFGGYIMTAGGSYVVTGEMIWIPINSSKQFYIFGFGAVNITTGTITITDCGYDV